MIIDQRGHFAIIVRALGEHTALRIGFLIDTFAIGGSELNAIKVAEALNDRSIALTVFHFQPDGPLRTRYVKRGIELVHVPLHGLVSRSAFDATRHIRSAAIDRGIQLLHTHCVYSNIVGAGVRRLSFRKLPLLASRRWTGYAERPGLHKLNALAQNAADAVLVNSPNLERVVKQESRWSQPVYIPNLLPDLSFSVISPEDRRARRIAFGLRPDGMIVGCVARLAAVKDHRTLITAWSEVVRERPDVTLAIFGDGDTRSALEAQSRELNISNNVHFVGEVRPESLPHAVLDISALASLDEGFPNSLLEAMAQGIPVVSTRVGGVPDLVSHEVNGLLVPPNDPSAFAQALLRLIQNPELAASLASNARRTAEAHRSEAVTDALLRTYRAIGLG